MSYTRQHGRKSIRLSHHNYAGEGAYFLTFLTKDREHWFGSIRNGMMCLNAHGTLAWQAWYETPNVRPEIELGAFIVMPNHIHAIIHITKSSPPIKPAFNCSPVRTVGSFIRGYKGAVARSIKNHLHLEASPPIWHRNYYEHIIRNEKAYDNIHNYIETNPARWKKDCFHTQ